MRWGEGWQECGGRGEGKGGGGEGQALISNLYKAPRSFPPSHPHHKHKYLKGQGGGRDKEGMVGAVVCVWGECRRGLREREMWGDGGE